jgi:hypothetical protein
MTVMSTSGRRFTIDTIVQRALNMAGLLEVSQALSSQPALRLFALDMLETVVDDLQTHGVIARAAGFYDLTLVAGTHRYSLPTSVLDVSGDGAYMPPGTADLTAASSEQLVSQIDRDAWHRISDKSATGQPTMFYTHRELDQAQVRLWPIPDADSAGYIRFPVHRHLADNTDGNATIDLDVYWQGYLIYKLASVCAQAQGLAQSAVLLDGQAANKLTEAKSTAKQQGPGQFFVDHNTGWTR